jgi:hypothetical protein
MFAMRGRRHAVEVFELLGTQRAPWCILQEA